mmetsp:Transcript_7490/g.12971  ORF Transcript_7490/g.12971 Transcript_7490/m.12971 type:complete len:99 (+) Transcript_7490:3-299(+)
MDAADQSTGRQESVCQPLVWYGRVNATNYQDRLGGLHRDVIGRNHAIHCKWTPELVKGAKAPRPLHLVNLSDGRKFATGQEDWVANPERLVEGFTKTM